MENRAREIDPRLTVLGRHVRDIRVRAGFSQVELAREAGISRTSLHALEAGTGSPNFSTLLDIADALGLAVHLLVPKGLSISR